MDRALREQILTVYGRKAVLEALQDRTLSCHALHLADSNRPAPVITEIATLASSRDIPVQRHSRQELSRISKNGKQDQGVALDILCPAFQSVDTYLASSASRPGRRLLALDGITNPQNLGMIIRSAAAGEIDGIVLPRRGNAALGPLVIKASAGTVFRAPLLQCDTLQPALQALQVAGAKICILDSGASQGLLQQPEADFTVYVLGAESEGVSGATRKLADAQFCIPMNNGVESLNVAVAASLIAFAPVFNREY